MDVETQDFYLSAFLRLKKLEMLGMKSFGSRKLFIFEDNDIFQKLKQEYYWNKAVVDPLEYKKEIRRLKDSIMHS
ncbi:MAG: hypothetical protein HN967_12340 [Candidatus Marinimicrobia bacterium]|jgi:hypothetical protein|nr:hypothetical protein [Candidatus Neomarinimicrobiota bacterium]MBT7021918.1 hypothetical protein [Candidatus Neomarinimicrobiota bacterium]